MLKRIVTLFLVLCLIPLGAVAEGMGVNFSLSFDMDTDAYPQDIQKLVSLLADVLNHLTVEGSLQMQGELFDLDTELTFYGAERTRTQLRVHGNKQIWHIDSSLTGHEKMYMFLDSMLEFAIKGQLYMDIPFQRAAVLLSPYVHENGVSDLWAEIKPVLFRQEGERTISRSELQGLALALSEASAGRAFRYWAAAIGRETGYEDILLDTMSMLPEWLDSFVTGKGLQITVKDGTETWTMGKKKLFECTTALDGAVSMTLSLPATPNGYTITGDAAFQPGSDLLHGSVHLHIVNAEGEDVLNLETAATLPAKLPVFGAFFLSWKADGLAVGGEGVHLYYEGESDGNTITLRQMTPDLTRTMLTVRAEGISTFEPYLTPPVMEGVSLLSVSSDTLASLVRTIARPMLSGLLPLLMELPASTCQGLMDLLEDSGVFGLLTGGVSSCGEDWDSFEDNPGGLDDLDNSDAPYVFID